MEKLSNSMMLVILVLLLACVSTQSKTSKPDRQDVASFSRYLVREGKWGVLTTLDGSGSPFGNIASYSDAGTGVPFFYLAIQIDPTGGFALNNPRACFTLSEAELDNCKGNDPQAPQCAKITLSGNLVSLNISTQEGQSAQKALFTAHPRFKEFPLKSGKFLVFKLDVLSIFAVTRPAAYVDLSPAEYFAAT